MKHLFSSACIFLCLAGGSPLAAQQVNDKEFLEMVGAVEGPDGYTSVTGYAPYKPPKPLTRMTVKEVIQYQKDIKAAGAKSTAVGRYQFILSTLSGLIRETGTDHTRYFDEQLQDVLARRLMQRCDFYSTSTDIGSLADCLAGHWAALPMATGKKKGKSRYLGVAGNRALVSLDDTIEAIESRFEPTGISIEEAFREVQLSVVTIPLK